MHNGEHRVRGRTRRHEALGGVVLECLLRHSNYVHHVDRCRHIDYTQQASKPKKGGIYYDTDRKLFDERQIGRLGKAAFFVQDG